MRIFNLVKYHNRVYPDDIKLEIEEVAGHFDIRTVITDMEYSLHTEYSYGKREFRNQHLEKYPTICAASKNNVPMLWQNEKWAEEYAHYIIDITANLRAPRVVEIHPPFSDYIDDLKHFASVYRIFEDILLDKYPKTQILIENRCGSIYRGGKFIFSNRDSIIKLTEIIEQEKLGLRITLDIPQLYTAHNVTIKTREQVTSLIESLKTVRDYFIGVHLWGKGTSKSGRRTSHCGDLNTYFNNDTVLKTEFLEAIAMLFNDDVIRYLVLEVNSSNEDLQSILKDLKSVEFQFQLN